MPDTPPNTERLIRLTPDLQIKPFDCDDDDLNDFFLNSSKKYLNDLLAVTYIIENDEHTIAFFSILNDKVSAHELKSNSAWDVFKSENFPPGKQLRSYPAVKIGRLGVNKGYKSKGYGRSIISFMIDSFLSSNKTGCRFITVDAYQESLSFYSKCNFIFMTTKDEGKDTRLMYLDLLPYASLAT
ncbi:MAG: GNAT family N-acetyltransferase [Bacteroidetes bacterium]|jgi:predicted GNAT family N-acyltransferase|nr:GNAT family N-acetyltransferase [Bacteroidota bacterium]